MWHWPGNSPDTTHSQQLCDVAIRYTLKRLPLRDMSEPTAHSEAFEFLTEMKFRRYFTTHPDPAFKKRYPGRLEIVDFGEVVLSDAVITLRNATNERHDANWAQIQAADGITGLHLDYLDSPERNAFAFYFDDLACIAITKGAVTRVLQIALVMSNSPSVRASLGLPTIDSSTEEDTSGVNLTGSLFTTIMQVLSSHELGHIFHGHYFESARGLPLDEDRTTEKPCFSQNIEHSLRSQAMEVDADGYSAHMIVQNLFDGGMGDALHRYTGSTLPLDKFILKFLLLSAGGLFYLWSPRTFEEGSVEMCDQPLRSNANECIHDRHEWLARRTQTAPRRLGNHTTLSSAHGGSGFSK